MGNAGHSPRLLHLNSCAILKTSILTRRSDDSFQQILESTDGSTWAPDCNPTCATNCQPTPRTPPPLPSTHRIIIDGENFDVTVTSNDRKGNGVGQRRDSLGPNNYELSSDMDQKMAPGPPSHLHRVVPSTSAGHRAAALRHSFQFTLCATKRTVASIEPSIDIRSM